MIVFYIVHTIMENCLNCNTTLLSEQKFCSTCGQKVPTKRLDLHDISHDVIHYFTHADKGIFQLLKALVTKTGIVAKEYVEGKRKKYFPPLNFFLIVAALYVFTTSLTLNHANSSIKQTTSTTSYQSQQNKNAPTSISEQQRKRAPVDRFFAKYANFVAMFAAPFISLFIWLVYFRGKYNYTEHLVANLYLIGLTNLIRLLFTSPIMAIFNISQGSQGLQVFFVSFEILYRSVFYYQFMGQYDGKGKLKSFVIALLTLAFWWLFIGTSIAIYFMLTS